MRIAYLAPFDLTEAAGHVAHVIGTLRNLIKRGEQITLYAKDCPTELARALRFRRVPTPRVPGLTSAAFGAAAAAMLARDWGELDVVYTRYFKSVVLPLLVAHARRIPTVVEVNASLANERRVNRVAWAAQQLEMLEDRLVFRSATATIAVTEAIKRELERTYRPPGKVVVVENGVDSSLYRPMEQRAARIELGLDVTKMYVVFAGALQPWQGIVHLVQAAAIAAKSLPTLRLLIIGDGPERQKALDVALKLGFGDRVTITGFVPEEQVVPYLAAADLCVAPYDIQAVDDSEEDKLRYGVRMSRSPLKVLTYMACGRPIIASHFAETGAYLARESAGIATPPNDPQALAAALVEVLTRPDWARSLGNNARRLAVAYHDWDVVVGRYLNVVSEARDATR